MWSATSGSGGRCTSRAGIHIALLLGGVVGGRLRPYAVARGIGMVGAGAGLACTSVAKEQRAKNSFTFGPIVEVAVLFAGIFVTMVPALALLHSHGGAWDSATRRPVLPGHRRALLGARQRARRT
jgi:Na+/H+ antiporter NhaD/arsenite permease-like protein